MVKKIAIFSLILFYIYQVFSQNVSEYFVINKNYYRIKDTTDIEILQYNLKSAEIILKYFGEPNLKQFKNPVTRIIFFPIDTTKLSFIVRLWKNNDTIHKRIIVFQYKIDDNFKPYVDTVLCDSIIIVKKKKEKKSFELMFSDIYNARFDNNYVMVNVLIESKEGKYQCLYYNNESYKSIDKRIRFIYRTLYPNVKIKYEKKILKTQVLVVLITIGISTLLSNFL